jgi:hypothetical protein
LVDAQMGCMSHCLFQGRAFAVDVEALYKAATSIANDCDAKSVDMCDSMVAEGQYAR